jgi:small-conductance mechanosensitive channel
VVGTIRTRTEMPPHDQRRLLVSSRNVFLFLLLVGLALIWAPQLRTLALSLTAVAVAIVVATKELILCLSGAVLRATARAFDVGDWIEVEDKISIVERVGLRSSSFRDVDGILHHVLNGYIQRVGNLSQEWARATFDVPVSLDADLLAAKAVIYEVATGLAEDPIWGPDIIGPPEIWGVQELGPDGIRVRLVLPTKPMVNFDVTRQLRERMKLAFDAHGIRMPAHQVDLSGMRTGFPVATSPVDESGRHAADPRSEPGSTPQPDVTAEWRLERGDEVRPD